MDKSVSIIGLGYIGLPTALLLADAGVVVTGYDVDATKIATLRSGKLFFEEPGLSELFASVQKKDTFTATESLATADIYVIAVPTPTKVGTADLTYVMQALQSIEKVAKDGDLVIVESTIGPRDCVDHIIPTIEQWSARCHFAHCTERAIPGSTLHEMVNNDRVVGGVDEESTAIAVELYKTFVKGEIFTTDPTTAAVCKVMENTYRAVNIALANEFAKLAPSYNFNVWEAINLTNKHPRVNVHTPGPGVGGHCIPIDPYFFLDGTDNSALIKQSLAVNEAMPAYIKNALDTLVQKHSLIKPTVGILGYAYKKNVDDARETPAQHLKELLKDDYEVLMTDPYVERPDIVDLDKALQQAEVLILITDHDVFKDIDFREYPSLKFLIDTRNLFAGHANLGDLVVYTLGKDI